MYQNMCNEAKEVLRGKCIAWNANNRKGERSQINNLSFYLKKLEKEKNCTEKENYRLLFPSILRCRNFP